MVFRYPGGKSKLLEPIKKHLYPLIAKTQAFAEPFVGGGSVVVQVAKDFPNVRKIYINDKDPAMYAFWKLIQRNDPEDFRQLGIYLNLAPTMGTFKLLREQGLVGNLGRQAYYAVFFNRTTFSGIQTSGPLGGYEQKSKYKIDCRYNAKRLIAEIEDLRILLKGRISVTNKDCVDFLSDRDEVATYLDPPYFVKGKDLYPTHMKPEEHGALADVLRERKNWVLSYDICPEIDTLYKFAKKIPLNARYSIRDKKKSWTDKKEYIIVPK